MAYNTQEERFVVKGSERITRDLQVNGTAYVNNLVVANGIADLNVSNLSVDNVTLNNDLIANGLAGNDGQVLGKVNGKVEWFSPAAIDTNDFKVNYLTVNNSANITDSNIINTNVANLVAENAVINNGTADGLNVASLTVNDLNGNNGYIDTLAVNNLTANTFITNQVVDDLTVNNLTVNVSANIDGNSFIHKGFDVTSMTVISEDDYNNLGWEYRNSALYMTYPNGNMYFYGIKYAATSIPKQYTAYVDLPNMANNMQALTTSTLTFTTGAVTNSFVNDGTYNGIKEKTSFVDGWNNSLPVGTKANDGSITTNADKLYIINASSMYRFCSNLTDTFITNPSLITGAPANYNPLKYCTDMAFMFSGCSSLNFNQPINIPDNVTNMPYTFSGCSKFNQPITIPDNVTEMSYAFQRCNNFNQPITIGNNVYNMSNTFSGCSKFNQPIIIPDNVTNMSHTFSGCYNFNQPITIPDNVTNIYYTFESCLNFNQPITIGSNVTEMGFAFQNCYNFNQPITIPDNVWDMGGTFYGCYNFNQPVTIGSNVTDMSYTFYMCSSFNQPITIPDNVYNMYGTFSSCDALTFSSVPIHISHNITLGDTTNYIYNALVNSYTGINWTGRILNDA